MRRITTRTRWAAGLTAAGAALAAAVVGTAGAQAAPPARASVPAPGGGSSAAPASGLQGRAPTSAVLGLKHHAAGTAGTAVVRVRFKPGVQVSAAAKAAPLAVGAKAYAARTRSLAPLVHAATYTVASADAAGFISSMKSRGDVVDASLDIQAHYDFVPNDPQFKTVSTTDFDQFRYLPSIGALAAWNYGRGSATVKVAVIDSGADVGHPDLTSKIASGDAWNVVSGSSNVTDTVGHGTFVSGVAAAATNNGVGVAGAGFNAGLMVVKVADANGDLFLTDVAQGIRWATDHGAKVLNLSLGADADLPTHDLRDAVLYAQSHGALVVSSAGNGAQEGNLKSYPAAFAGVISVGATDAKGHRAWFSENGSWVSMAAPGINIRSTTVRAGSDLWPAGSYANGDGTSFSSPLVAGAAALVWGRTPTATAAQIRTAVVNTAHGYAGLGLGKGQLDMAKAMQVYPPSTPNPTITAPAGGAAVSGPVSLTATVGTFNAGIGVKVGWYVDGTRVGFSSSGASFSWAPQGYAEGAHTIQARNCTLAGVCRTTGSSVSVNVGLTAPTLTDPGAPVTGGTQFAVDSPAGGGVAIYEGSTRRGFTNVSPYRPEVNFTPLADGTHTLVARICNSAGTLCAGNASAPVTVTSATAKVTRGTVTNPAFSPNADGVKDTMTVAYTTTGAQTVTAVVRNAAGTTVRTVAVGSRTGASTFVWNGRNNSQVLVPAGTYQVRIQTVVDATHHGLVTASARVDNVSPTVTLPAGTATTIYPVVDTYKDTFVPKFRVNENSRVTLTVKSSAGRTVRTLAQTVLAGKSGTLTWNGRNAAGTLQPAGTYKWSLTAVDGAGRKRTTAAKSLVLRRTKLTTRTTTLAAKTGQKAFAINSGPACAGVTVSGTSYAGGLWLKNNCAASTPGSSAAYFHFTVPSAVKYTGFTLKTAGRSHSAPADVLGGIYSRETDDDDITGVTVKAGATTTRTLTLGTIHTQGHVPANRVIEVAVFVPNTHAPLTDWDIKTVSVTVTYKVLA